MSGDQLLLAFEILSVGAGLVMTMVGIFFGIRTVNFLRQAVKTQGTVIGYENRQSRDAERTYTLYHPIVQFRDAKGEEQRVTMGLGNTSKSHAQGYQVNILFDPKNPANARIDSFVSKWLFPSAFCGLGLMTLITGLLVLVLFWK